MSGQSLNMVAQKLSLHPDLVAGLTCTVGIIQNFSFDPAGTLFIAIDADFSDRESAVWKLYRRLAGKEVDRDN
jgi:hypothetical protein